MPATLGRFEWLDLPGLVAPASDPPAPGPIPDAPAPGPIAATALDSHDAQTLALPPQIEILPVAARWPLESATLWHLRRQADHLRLATGFDRLLCLDACRIDHHPHQERAALRALRDMRGRALLADEVGLGKTVEAGLVMKELLVRGLAHRVLVLAPASLTLQWQEELKTKFDEAFALIKHQDDWEARLAIASLDLARQPAHAALALAQAYDLVIVDEAHKLKRRTTQAHQLVARLNRRYMLLLTATPVQNDLTELYALINLLVEGQLGTPRAFDANFIDPEDRRMPMNQGRLKEYLAAVMVRNRRSAVGLDLPPRKAAIYHLDMPPDERALYDDLSDFIQEELELHPDQGHLRLVLGVLQRGLSSSPAAVIQTLERLKDSPDLKPESRSELAGFAAQAAAIPLGRKVEGVAELLARLPDEKVLVYTEFRASQQAIANHLGQLGYAVALFHGGLDANERAAVVARFRLATETPGAAQVMISTESGAEGLNLQFCHHLVNFDLPWNPMRVEQRIGRLHRLGQTQPVTIINMAFEDTIEAHLVDLLARKIRLFELVVGELDQILGALDERRSFEDLVAQAWQAGRGRDGADTQADAFGAIARGIAGAHARYAQVKRAGEALGAVIG